MAVVVKGFVGNNLQVVERCDHRRDNWPGRVLNFSFEGGWKDALEVSKTKSKNFRVCSKSGIWLSLRLLEATKELHMAVIQGTQSNILQPLVSGRP